MKVHTQLYSDNLSDVVDTINSIDFAQNNQKKYGPNPKGFHDE